MGRRRTDRSGTSGSGNTRTMVIGGAILIGVVGLGIILFLNLRGSQPIQGVEIFSRQERGHVDTDIEMGTLPPPGGLHNPIWQNCGVYREIVEPKHAVHSLEHGAVWITYHPDLPQDQIDALEQKARGESFVLLSPWPDLQSPVVMTAWQVQLELESANDNRIDRFLSEYVIGPYTPERGASCSGGIGTPVQ